MGMKALFYDRLIPNGLMSDFRRSDGLITTVTRVPHIEDNFPFEILPSRILKDVNQTHFNPLPGGKMRPAAITHHLERRPRNDGRTGQRTRRAVSFFGLSLRVVL